MATTEQLTERLEALRKARALGVTQTHLADGRFLIYRTDAEMAASIGDLERQLGAAEGAPVHTIRIAASKGLDT